MRQQGGWKWTLALAAVAAIEALAATQAPPEAAKNAAASGRYLKEGLVIDFSARPAKGASRLVEGQLAEIEFRITDEAGNPVRSNVPGAWLDIADLIRAQEGGEQKSCKDKIALYLRGVVGIRPMVDLNSYHVMIMNQEPSVTVIDPLVSMAGATSTLATVRLKSRGADWASHPPAKAIFVSMPLAGQVAVIDTDDFHVRKNIAAGKAPTRVAVQPDGRYLWVGNNDDQSGGVTIIDTESLEKVAAIGTGRGHHEIAFSADSRHAFVTNRDEGTVSVIDVPSKRKLRDLRTGPLPISIARSALSGGVYVADGRDGTVTVIDGATGEIRRRVKLEAGLGPLRFTPDGRFALVLHPAASKVHVIDASSDQKVQSIDVEKQPYQLSFSRAFAYVRGLASERVSMVNLASLGKGKKAIVQSFQAGTGVPGKAEDLALADTMAPASTEAAMMVVNPVENATYFYMEGMNAPASSYKAYGSRARAVTLVDRSLKEMEPGVYRSWVRMPAAGKFDVAMLMNSPRVMHCFSAEVAADPKLAAARHPTLLQFVAGTQPGTPGEKRAVRFRITDGATGEPRTGLTDVRVISVLAPSRSRREQVAREVGDGVYEVQISLDEPGAYYMRAASEQARFGFNELAPGSIRVKPGNAAATAPGVPGSPRS